MKVSGFDDADNVSSSFKKMTFFTSFAIAGFSISYHLTLCKLKYFKCR